MVNTLNTATLCTPHKVNVRPLTADSAEALPQELTEGGVQGRDNDNDWDQIQSLHEGQIAGVTLLTEKVSTLADVTTVMLVYRVERLFDSGLVVALEFH